MTTADQILYRDYLMELEHDAHGAPPYYPRGSTILTRPALFLMPAKDVRARMPRRNTIDSVMQGKSRWRVSAMAMAYRLSALRLLSDWQYKSMCIELGKRGFRAGEPDGIERETSVIWRKVLTQLWAEKTTKNDIAASLHLPLDELEGPDLEFGRGPKPSDCWGASRSNNLNSRRHRGVREIKLLQGLIVAGAVIPALGQFLL